MENKQTHSTRIGRPALHFQVQGRFTPHKAMELVTAMHAASQQVKGNMFIHTAEMTGLEPGSGKVFAGLLKKYSLPVTDMYCTGEMGFHIMDDMGRLPVTGG